MIMELETIEYDYGMAKHYAERSEREALLWSVLKWLHFSTVHESRLRGAWHVICGVCWRYASPKDGCVKCPLTIYGEKCTDSDESLWRKVETAYDTWNHGYGSKQDIKAFRVAAREFARVLVRIYNRTYEDKIKVDFGGMKIVSTNC